MPSLASLQGHRVYVCVCDGKRERERENIVLLHAHVFILSALSGEHYLENVKKPELCECVLSDAYSH